MKLTLAQTISLARQTAEWLGATEITSNKLNLISELLRDICYVSYMRQYHEGKIVGYLIEVYEPKGFEVVYRAEIPVPNLPY